MPTTTTLSDPSRMVTVISDQALHIHHVTYQDFIHRLEDVHSIMPLGSLLVEPLATNEYHYTLTTASGRIIHQHLKKGIGSDWEIQPLDSGFFTLSELLINNFLRTAVQDLIDAVKVTNVSAVFV